MRKKKAAKTVNQMPLNDALDIVIRMAEHYLDAAARGGVDVGEAREKLNMAVDVLGVWLEINRGR